MMHAKSTDASTRQPPMPSMLAAAMYLSRLFSTPTPLYIGRLTGITWMNASGGDMRLFRHRHAAILIIVISQTPPGDIYGHLMR